MGIFNSSVFGKPLQKFIKGDSPDYGAEAARAEAERQERIQRGIADVNVAFAGFTPSFYDDRAKAFVDYALPQLAGQYQTTRNQLLQSLASRGLLNSSTGRQQGSTLQKTMEGAKQTLVEGGRTQAQDLQRQVEDKRSAIIGQVYQAADPANARASAVTTAAGFRQPSTFAPLANMFSSLAGQYYSNALLEATKKTPSYYDQDFDAINPSAVGGGVTSRRIY